jgi:hypothetical protein
MVADMGAWIDADEPAADVDFEMLGAVDGAPGEAEVIEFGDKLLR